MIRLCCTNLASFGSNLQSNIQKFIINTCLVLLVNLKKSFQNAEISMRRAYNKLKTISHKNIFKEWEPLLNNLGHVCRKLKFVRLNFKNKRFHLKFSSILKNRKYNDSLEFHRKALALQPTNSSTWTSIGLTNIFLNKFDDAIDYFHQVKIPHQV